MGQTLTHGVYLPDEGERNCYSGLAANWQILDTSVGTIAAHTAALAGKAPLVHTHTKSDITDLFNSANTWTENNIFSNFITSKESAAIPAGGYGKGIAFRDYQNNRLGYIQPFLTSNNEKRLLIGADSGDIASNSNIIPNANNSVNLGTSTNKWETLNGVNPGALSIFNPSATQDPIDVPTTWVTDGSAWNTLNVSNMGDGWICITYNNNSAGDYILVRFGGTSGASYPSLRFEAVKSSNNKYYIYALFPVAKAFSNIYLEMLINSNANLVLHHYIPAYGTV